MKRFYKSWRESAKTITNLKKKKMIPLTNNSTIPMKRQKSGTFAKKGSNIKCTNHEHYRKVKDHCHYKGQYRCAEYAIQEVV